MSDARSVIEREMERVEPRPYSFEAFQDRRRRDARRRRAGATVLGLLVGATVVLSMIYALRGREHPTPGDPSDLTRDRVRPPRLLVARYRCRINSTPVVAGDRVYVTNKGGSLLAFPTSCATAPGTCRPIWSANEVHDRRS